MSYVLAAALIVAAPVYSMQGKGRGKGHQQKESAQAAGPLDHAAVANYFHGNPSALPPGLAKRNGDLPPGLEKQLRRNGTLPPGLAKRVTPFPAELESRLPPCPPEMHRGIVGSVAILFNSRTGLIVDAVVVARL